MAPNKQIPNPIGVSSPRPARQFTNQSGGQSSALKQQNVNSEDSQSPQTSAQGYSSNRKQTGQKQNSKALQGTPSNKPKAVASNGNVPSNQSTEAGNNDISSTNERQNNTNSKDYVSKNNSARNNNNAQQTAPNENNANDYVNENNDDTEGRELASKCLLFSYKRFYLDVKQNKRGRFIKIAEVSFNGRKSRIIFSMDTTREFCELLRTFQNFSACCETATKSDSEDQPSDERLKSERLQKGTRLYYFDLKENARGRYLRCTQFSTHAPSPRFQISIPEIHLIEFRASLLDLLDEFGSSNDSEQLDTLPTQQSKTSKPVRPSTSPRRSSASNNANSNANSNNNNNNNTNGALNDGADSGNEGSKEYMLECNKKKFLFEVNNNQMGSFVRITQVVGFYRKASITIPNDFLSKFGDLFNKCADEANQLSVA